MFVAFNVVMGKLALETSYTPSSLLLFDIRNWVFWSYIGFGVSFLLFYAFRFSESLVFTEGIPEQFHVFCT